MPRMQVQLRPSQRLRTVVSNRWGTRGLDGAVEMGSKIVSGVDYSMWVQTIEKEEVSAPPAFYALLLAPSPPVPVGSGGFSAGG